MTRLFHHLRPLSLVLLAATLLAGPWSLHAAARAGAAEPLTVYKSPTCGCCEHWLDHVHQRGFITEVEHPEDLGGEKARLGVAPRHQSCHTAVSRDGFIFEGHIPAGLITRFLEDRPEGAIGLAVPGMPVGSPGMEMGERFDPYDVLLLMADGSSRVYARVSSAAEQY
ncbi:MAG: DUF411 domain-containing protein [Porticoccaceae bacterium]